MSAEILEAYYNELAFTDMYETEEELLAYVFEHYITNELNTTKAQQPSHLKRCFNTFIKYVESTHIDINLNDIFNSTIYNWYFGNCLTYFYTLLLQPELYITQFVQFSYEFVQSVVDIVYNLVSKYNCSTSCIDYHDLTIFDYLNRLSQEHTEKITMHRDHYRLLLSLARFGKGALEIQKKRRF